MASLALGLEEGLYSSKRPKSSESSSSQVSIYGTPPSTPMSEHHVGHRTDVSMGEEMSLGSTAPGSSKLAGNMPPVTLISSGAANLTNGESKIFKFKNTFKVFFDNTEDITIAKENFYTWYDPFIPNQANIQRETKILPIYDHNGQIRQIDSTSTQEMGNHCVYTKLPWKLIPTLKKDNYVSPSQWNEMLADGWDCAKEIGKRTRISGLYQMHSYEQSGQNEVQNQTNPYVEFCSPVGQFFKHEHYRIDSILGNNVNPIDTTLANAALDRQIQEDNFMPIVMNAVESFKANTNDLDALGVLTDLYGIDRVLYDNSLRSYYYPTWNAALTNHVFDGETTTSYITGIKDRFCDWYPDLTSTQTIHMTDLLDDYVHEVPVDTQMVNLGNYVHFVRPGLIALKNQVIPSDGTNQSCYSNTILADWTTDAIGHVNYIKSAGPNDIEEWQKDDIYKNTPPLLVRIPNHPNSGNQLINNKCYMYITYEVEYECQKYKMRPLTTFANKPLVLTKDTLPNCLKLTGLYRNNTVLNQGDRMNPTIEVLIGKYAPVYKITVSGTEKCRQFTLLNDQVVQPRGQRRKQRRWNPVVDNCFIKKAVTIVDVKRENVGFSHTTNNDYTMEENLSDNIGFQPKQN